MTEQPPPRHQHGAAPTVERARRRLSAGQIRAIFDAMRTFRDDDLSRTGGEESFICDRCGRRRPAAGSLLYGELRLCNGCATDYELLRTAGIEGDILVVHPNGAPAEDGTDA